MEETFFQRTSCLAPRIVPGKVVLVVFPPKVIEEIKTLSCKTPDVNNIPLSPLSNVDIACEEVKNGIVAVVQHV